MKTSPKHPRFRADTVVETPILEGKTYLARIKGGRDSHWKMKRRVGRIVKVTAYGVVNIEWPSGHRNSIARGGVEIIGECR